jgi:hypothetical protein
MKLTAAKVHTLYVFVQNESGRRLATKKEIEKYIAPYFDNTIIDLPNARHWDFTIPSDIGEFILSNKPYRLSGP